MGFISRAKEAIKDWVQEIIHRITGRSEEWERKRAIIRETRRLLNSEIQYEPEEPDKQLALQAAAYLKNRFPNGIQETLGEMSIDERMMLFQDLAEEVRCLFEVDGIQIEIKAPETELECRSMGVYYHAGPLLYLNAAYIQCDSPEMQEEQVFTIFHEMKHARQWAAVEQTHDYGYSNELLEEWKYNMIVYIRPEENDEAYRKQALERDTFGFEDLVRENMKL